jgi:hypothetical protein
MSNPAFESSPGPVGEQPWHEVVSRQVAKLRFGSVLITVHEGRVTQVESVEKTRFVAAARDGQTR